MRYRAFFLFNASLRVCSCWRRERGVSCPIPPLPKWPQHDPRCAVCLSREPGFRATGTTARARTCPRGWGLPLQCFTARDVAQDQSARRVSPRGRGCSGDPGVAALRGASARPCAVKNISRFLVQESSESLLCPVRLPGRRQRSLGSLRGACSRGAPRTSWGSQRRFGWELKPECRGEGFPRGPQTPRAGR